MVHFGLVLWLLAFCATAGLMGITMYTLIGVADLENDFINPHDAADRLNRLVVPEYALHAAATLAFLATGQWLAFLVNAPLLAYHARKYLRKTHYVYVTDIFRQLPGEKRERLFKLFFHLLFFVVVIYKLVEAAVDASMDDGPAPKRLAYRHPPTFADFRHM